MSKSLPSPTESTDVSAKVASSAVVVGHPRFGERSLLSEGAVVRSSGSGVTVGTDSAILENCVVVGTAAIPTAIGRRSVFGHRCLVVGATVGDLCEIGNASILMPGARLGDRVFLGEGTLVRSGMELPSDVVAVGRPARIIRSASPADLERLRGLRGGDLSLPPHTSTVLEPALEGLRMGQLYDYRGITPTIATSAVLFPTSEITGDVVIGERTIIGAGVKIIGDSHGPVRIGDDVQILENTVLHLLPDNELVIHDGATVGPGAMIHGCHIGAGTIVEPGAIVCDGSIVGAGCIVRAGAVVKQRARFGDAVEIDGFPAENVGAIRPPGRPAWALPADDLPMPTNDAHRRGRRRGPMLTAITDLHDFEALDPFFRIIEEGLEGIADGWHFFDLLAEDVVFDYIITTPGYPRHVEGRQAVAELYRPYGTMLVLDRCYDLAVHHDTTTGVVVLEYASEGRVVSTGAPYANRYISVLTVTDRKVTHWRDYLDPIAVFDALGWPTH